MMIQIKSRYTGSLLIQVEAGSLKAALEIAVGQHANLGDADLRGANLRDADLGDANLGGANLGGADLRGADLRDANLGGADLRGADLRDADLRGADLRGANLGDANLRRADLRSANLRGADLRGADLRRADLGDADLGGAKGLVPERITPLLLLREQPGAIRAYKLVTADGVGPYNGGLRYEIGQAVAVTDADVDPIVQCGAGINLATLDWCLLHWEPGFRVLIAEFTASDIAAIPTATDGKFRVRRCAIVGEKDLAGLVPVPAAATVPA